MDGGRDMDSKKLGNKSTFTACGSGPQRERTGLRELPKSGVSKGGPIPGGVGQVTPDRYKISGHFRRWGKGA